MASATNKSQQRCAGCKSLLQREYISCSLCKSKYDLLCANISIERFKLMEREHKRSWRCPECHGKQPKTDNTNTPVRYIAPTIHDSIDVPVSSDSPEAMVNHITQRQKQLSSFSPTKSQGEFLTENSTVKEIGHFVSELRAFRIEMSLFRTTLAELTETIKQSNTRIDILETKVESIEHRRNDKNNLDMEAVKATIAQLTQDLQDRDQDLLANDIEIAGFPETNGEGTTHIVLAVATKLGVALEERDIVTADRVGPPHAFIEGGPAPRPRPLVVRLARRAQRDAMLHGARVRRGATTADMGIAGNPRLFYVNERLSKFNRQLFQRARELARKVNWRFVWTRDGKVYTRRENGKERHRLRSEADFKRVFGLDTVGAIIAN